MEYLKIDGSRSEIRDSLVELGIPTLRDAEKVLNVLLQHSELLDSSESVTATLVPSETPETSLGLMLSEYTYYINVKITTIVVAALISDILLTEGIVSALLGLCGFSSTAFAKISEENGEKCIVKETLSTDKKIGSSKILTRFKGECCNNHLNCGFNIDGTCACREDDILAIYQRLAEKNMFQRLPGNFYKYQW